MCGGLSHPKLHVIQTECSAAKCDLQVASTIGLPREGVSCVASRPDFRIFAIAGWDHRVGVFSWLRSSRWPFSGSILIPCSAWTSAAALVLV